MNLTESQDLPPSNLKNRRQGFTRGPFFWILFLGKQEKYQPPGSQAYVKTYSNIIWDSPLWWSRELLTINLNNLTENRCPGAWEKRASLD
ncbi:MAG: hypothetical protein A2786_05520 [Candidatus Chisholmbacteria bacterium RIFCSPHIGHO2_01_FULL_52_32]|uniref:Uncharacterized protein n=1 Tax=Candidatus Chisholmbacteria bacterium RIFCSPHIGHO2_01_FULL_52_32 TaxID=1797591 RepID=A0A1G1VQY0_9BACT|nr:MAG: hypothetical protein A2786_05520 [Candidatus Chisholmbacteria bacterium RIFCSPHIGHO2_01_FULL_52_32]